MKRYVDRKQAEQKALKLKKDAKKQHKNKKKMKARQKELEAEVKKTPELDDFEEE